MTSDLGQVAAGFERYERALMANDLATLDELFLDEADTLRADASGVLTGAEAIRGFRRGRGGAPQRIVDRLHLRAVGDGVVVALAELRRADGGRGLQTQVWVRRDPGWRIAAAHVSSHAADADPIWRLRGTPLVTGAPDGPLTGLTVAVKDLFAVAGYRRGAGVPRWLIEAPTEPAHAAAVQRLLDSGADVAGIAQTDQLAYSLAGQNAAYGTPPNPAVPNGLPGGSSSGPASAVSLGQADVGLGTDTGGSIRVPASYQGLFGLRPTHGAVSADGLIPLAPRFDTVGWLTRSAEVLHRIGEVLLAPAKPRPITRLLLAADLLALADPEVAEAVERAARELARAAHLEVEVTDEVTGGEIDSWLSTFRTLQLAEAERSHGSWVRAHAGALGSDVAQRFTNAAAVTAKDEAVAEQQAAAVRSRLLARVTPGVCLVAPGASSTAPPAAIDPPAMTVTRSATLRLTCLSGLSGAPAVVLPTLTSTGLPAGLCLLGAVGCDRDLLELARRYDAGR